MKLSENDHGGKSRVGAKGEGPMGWWWNQDGQPELRVVAGFMN